MSSRALDSSDSLLRPTQRAFWKLLEGIGSVRGRFYIPPVVPNRGPCRLWCTEQRLLDWNPVTNSNNSNISHISNNQKK